MQILRFAQNDRLSRKRSEESHPLEALFRSRLACLLLCRLTDLVLW
jgi:hypothetical protein